MLAPDRLERRRHAQRHIQRRDDIVELLMRSRRVVGNVAEQARPAACPPAATLNCDLIYEA